MSDSGNDGNGSSINLIALLLLILSATGALIEPLTSARPSEPGSTQAKQDRLENFIETRLWQDPFAFASRESAVSSDHFNTLRNELKDFYRYKNFSVVAISLSGSSYYEIAESRRRSRFAVVSALHSQRFYPSNSEKLSYYELKNDCGSRLRIPYEWFDQEEDKVPTILVLWLDEHEIKKSNKNYTKFIDCLANEINHEWHQVWHDHEKKRPDRQAIDFKLIGPSSTASLVDLLQSDPFKYPSIRVFAHSATTSAREIIKSLRANCSLDDKNRRHRKWYCSPDEEFKSQSAIKLEEQLQKMLEERSITRTIGTDDKLATALLWELWNRRINRSDKPFSYFDVDQKVDCKDGVILIAELDTLYARSLVNNLENNAFWNHCETSINGKEIKPPVKSYAYLRGVDGVDGKIPSSEKNADRSGMQVIDKNSIMQWDDAPPEHAEGRNQYDYLRRLTDTISDLDRDAGFAKNGVKAIGILGSDVYDKLIILHALRERFKDKIFFTTDLDARYLHADQLKWTRNLVVASNFDLYLHSDWQKNSMPFRDSYQTSIYYATSLALNAVVQKDKQKSPEPMNPQIFEVGRSRAIHLDSPNVRYLGDWVQCLDSFTRLKEDLQKRSCKQIDDEYPFDNPSFFKVERGYENASIEPERLLLKKLRNEEIIENTLCLVFIMMAIWLGHSFLMKRMGLRLLLDSSHKIGAISYIKLLLTLGFITIIGSIAFTREGIYEPFIWLEGISVWPNLVIRFVGIFFILLLLVFFHERLSACKKEIQVDFFADHSSQAWESYDSTMRTTKMRLGILYATLVALGLTLWFLIPNYFQPSGLLRALNFPYRGEFAHTAHLFLAIIQFTVLWGLVFWIAFEAKACRKLIDQLQNSDTNEDCNQSWSCAILKKQAYELGVSEGYIKKYLKLWLVVKITGCLGCLIYLPLGMILAILIGRSKIFDQFNIPLSLIIVFAIAVIYLLLSIYQLRKSAENLRGDLLKHYEAQQIGFGVLQKKSEEIQIERIIYLINKENKGIYARFDHQPALVALLIPFGGMSGVQILEYLFNI